jgi:platelet-activating factor acetylhydrolase IB subunit alpha
VDTITLFLLSLFYLGIFLHCNTDTLISLKLPFIYSGDFVITCSRDNTLKCWEVGTGYCTRTFTGHSDWVRCLSVSLDGIHVASGSSDQSIVVWKISTGQVVQTLRGHEHVVECVSFGKKPVLASLLEAKSSGSSSIDTAAIDGSAPTEYSYVASGSRDRTVKLW